MDTIGDKIKQARTQAGFNVVTLAELLGVTPKAVYSWESDTVVPGLLRVKNLATICKVSLDWLILGKER